MTVELTYKQYLKRSMKAQTTYIVGEQARMAEAQRLFDIYAQAMSVLGLHPLTRMEIVDRHRELDRMLADVPKTHGDTEGQRAIYNLNIAGSREIAGWNEAEVKWEREAETLTKRISALQSQPVT